MTKILAFIEPGPNLVQYLVAVGERLAPHDSPVFFSTRVKSRSLLRRLGQKIYPRGSWPGVPDGAATTELNREWMIARLRKDSDRDQIRDDTLRVRRLILRLDRFMEEQSPAALFFWNGSGLTTVLAESLARRRGIPCLFAENGYLPNTLQLDPSGVNAFSSIAQDCSLDAIRSRVFTDEQIDEFDRLITDYRAGRSPSRTPPPGGRVRPSPLAYLIQGWHDLHEREPRHRVNRLVPRAMPALPDRFVFFPLQVKSDSQLTIHSPLYSNRLELAIRDLDRALSRLDGGVRLVVKLHPADLGKTDYDPIVREYPRVLWVAGGDVRSILEPALAVVTVNSTVGVEGMLFDRPIIALGDNFYVREGLVHRIRDPADLSQTLQRALTEPPDTHLVRQFLRYLYFEALVRAHWRDYSETSVGNLAQRIILLLGA